jgi:TatD DNase family protein
MNSGLVDFHCHLDLFPDHAAAVTEAEKAQVYTLAVTTTPKAWPRNHELALRTRYVRAALGLHPQLVSERAGELPLWEEYLPQAKYIGEIGIDAGPNYYRSLEIQTGVFEHILRKCAASGEKILTVHSIRAAKTVLDLIEKHLSAGNCGVVLHWFTGSISEARRATELGCYFSVNARMLQNDKGRALVSALPGDRLLTETDAPFTQIGGRPSRPSDIGSTVAALASVRLIGSDEMVLKIRENLRCLLGKDPVRDEL